MANRKSAGELRIERITWFALVAVFVLLNIVPDDTAIPNATVPFAGGAILMVSGVYQYFRKWRVNFVTWIIATLMLVMGAYNIYSRPDLNLTFVAFILVGIVIAVGIITNET